MFDTGLPEDVSSAAKIGDTMYKPKTQRGEELDRIYKKEKCKRLSVRFFPSDMHLYDFVKDKDNMAGYIKGLIKADMEREGIR